MASKIPLDHYTDRRIRRFSTSRGFWNTPHKPPHENAVSPQKRQSHSYIDRIASCGKSVNLFEVDESLDLETGEITATRRWVGQLNAEASVVMDNLFDPGNPDRPRRSLLAHSPGQAKQIIEAAAGREVDWIKSKNQLIRV